MGGMHQDRWDGWYSAEGCPALRQAPDPRLPRRLGRLDPRSARVSGCLCVPAVCAVSASFCLLARLRALLARSWSSNVEEVVCAAEASSSTVSRKTLAAFAERRRRLRFCVKLRRMYLTNSRSWTRWAPPPMKAPDREPTADHHREQFVLKTGTMCRCVVVEVALLR